MEIAIIILLLALGALLLWHIFREKGAMEKAVRERLDSATQVWGDVRQSLGQLSTAAESIQRVGQDVSSLRDILRAPKLRGGLGELLLARLLEQILPPSHYTLEYQFKGGERVDAAIHLGSGIVPVDSKFPLEDFERLLKAQSEEEQKARRRELVRSIKGHIDSVTKYILPDEGTYDFALMYIPAENVYYETIIRDESFGEEGSLHSYALKKRVIPVSPHSFYAYLQAIALGLKGLRIEASAHEILQLLSRLQGDFGRFQQDFETIGTHLSHAARKYDEAERRLHRFGDKLLGVTEAPVGELKEGDKEQAEPGPESDS